MKAGYPSAKVVINEDKPRKGCFEVTVNGEVVSEPGTRVDPKQDSIKVIGKALPEEQPHVYYLLYKPKGYITGRNDPQGRKSVLELVEHLSVRMEPVGRLDYDTEGALLFEGGTENITIVEGDTVLVEIELYLTREIPGLGDAADSSDGGDEADSTADDGADSSADPPSDTSSEPDTDASAEASENDAGETESDAEEEAPSEG